MKTYTAVVERDTETGLFVGYVPGFSGAHSQGATLDELNENLKEVVGMLLEDGEPKLDAEFIGNFIILVKLIPGQLNIADPAERAVTLSALHRDGTFPVAHSGIQLLVSQNG